jgi:hypothetical protein
MKPAALAVALVVALVGSGASPAIADSRAEAIALFDQGIKDMKAGRLDKACAELQSSLDLAKDSGTKGALARCHGLAGQVASAWLLWRELADTAPSAKLRTDAAAQAAKLEPRLPRYTIKVAGKTPNLVVQLNGRTVASNMSVAVPIDPGKISVTASGRDGERATTEVWTHDYTAAEGETVAIEVPALAPIAAKVKVGKPVEPKPASSEVAGRRHTRHVLALVIGGLGLGGAGVGGYFGYDANTKFTDAKDACGKMLGNCPPGGYPRSRDLVAAAKTSATRSNIAFGAGGGLLVVAAIVWISAPSLEAKHVVVAPSVGSGSVGLMLGGAF